MSVYDKNRERIRAFRAQIKKGGDKKQFENRIASLQAKGPEWWVKYRDALGKVHREKVGSSKREAERRYNVRAGSVYEGTFFDPQKNKMRIKDVTKVYLEEKQTPERGGYKAARTNVAKIDKYLGNCTVEALSENPWYLIRFFQDFPEKGLSPKYLTNIRRTLRSAIQHAIDTRRVSLPGNPMDIVKMPVGTRKREVVPTESEYRKILQKAGAKDREPYVKSLIVAAWESGLRVGELLVMRWENVHLERRNGEMPWFKTAIEKQKGEVVERELPMSKPLWTQLSKMKNGHKDGPVWPVVNSPRKTLQAIFKEAEVPGLRLHDFRKAWKKRMKQRGHISELTKKGQGHATDSMDQYYTCFDRMDLEELVRDSWKNAK